MQTRMNDLRVSTGVAGLDEVLEGGFIGGRTYLITGPPGGGKTTFGWHFLQAGLEAGEQVLFITFGESERELRDDAARSGFAIDNAHFLDMSPSADALLNGITYNVFSSAEVELEPITTHLIEVVEKLRPSRIFFDSMSHLRFLASDAAQFRKHTLALLRFLIRLGAVVLLTSESTPNNPDDDLRFLTDGVLEISVSESERSILISKFRGSHVQPGRHSLRLQSDGAHVFPRLVPAAHSVEFGSSTMSSGIADLDRILHGGIERGTVTLITGPTGAGKTTLGVQFLKEAAAHGFRSAVYTFDENAETLLRRAESTNTPVRKMIETGSLFVKQIEALQYGPDEFASMVRADVEKNGTRIVMIDSISGYRISVPTDTLNQRIHALCKYLQNMGVTVLLINELQDITSFSISEVGISYLADNVIFIRYIEKSLPNGSAELGKGIGVLKKRLSDFDKRLYSMKITGNGIVVEEPLPSIFAQHMRQAS